MRYLPALIVFAVVIVLWEMSTAGIGRRVIPPPSAIVNAGLISKLKAGTEAGLRVDLGLLDTGTVITWAIGLIALAIVAKITGTIVGSFDATIEAIPSNSVRLSINSLRTVQVEHP